MDLCSEKVRMRKMRFLSQGAYKLVKGTRCVHRGPGSQMKSTSMGM